MLVSCLFALSLPPRRFRCTSLSLTRLWGGSIECEAVRAASWRPCRASTEFRSGSLFFSLADPLSLTQFSMREIVHLQTGQVSLRNRFPAQIPLPPPSLPTSAPLLPSSLSRTRLPPRNGPR